MAERNDPDAALMIRVKDGEESAFEALVEKYKQPVMNLIYRTVRDRVEAEDLAQQVFVQVYKSAHRYRTAAKFTTWLFTIARNLALNEIRRRSRHPADSMDSPGFDTGEPKGAFLPDPRAEGPPEQVLWTELQAKVEEAMASLPETQRTALILCRQEDVSYEEIAKVLECSVSAVKSIIFRGREELKRRLKPYLRSGEWRSS